MKILQAARRPDARLPADERDQRARPLPVGVPAHRRPDAARPVPRLHGRPAHPDGAAQRAPLLHPRARPRVPVLLAARLDASTGRGCCTSPRCSTTSPRAAAATTPSSASARCAASAATTASPSDDAALIEFLVAEHLTMSRIAQKEDLSDPDVIADFAAAVGSERRLTALYLLTVADIRGTSPKVWNAWKGKLLEDLYRLTLRALGGAAPEPRRRDRGDQARGAPAAQPALDAARHGRDAAVAARSSSATSRATTPARSPGTRARCGDHVETPMPVVRARASPARRRPAGAGLRARPAGPVRAHLRLLRRRRLHHPRRQGPHHDDRLRARHLPGHQPAPRARRATAT